LLASTKGKNKIRIRNKIDTSKQILLFHSFQFMSRLSPEYSMIDFIVAKMTKEKTFSYTRKETFRQGQPHEKS
jgi:hypothetical protein